MSAGEGLGARFDLDLGRIGIRLGRTTVVLVLLLVFREVVSFDDESSGGRVDDEGIRDMAGAILDLVRVRLVES